jgi:hypothetical protein
MRDVGWLVALEMLSSITMLAKKVAAPFGAVWKLHRTICLIRRPPRLEQEQVDETV